MSRLVTTLRDLFGRASGERFVMLTWLLTTVRYSFAMPTRLLPGRTATPPLLYG